MSEPKYKVGDKVRVVAENHRYFSPETEVKIFDIDAYGAYICEGVDVYGTTDMWTVLEADLTPIEEQTKERDFNCGKCGKGFNTLESLSWHKSECKPEEQTNKDFKFTVSKNEVINEYCNDTQSIYHDHNFVIALEKFAEWLKKKEKTMTSKDHSGLKEGEGQGYFPDNSFDEIQQITLKGFEHWTKLHVYLNREYLKGKTEFRIAWQNPQHFVVHPLNKDGETLDMYFDKRERSPIENFPNHPHLIEPKEQVSKGPEQHLDKMNDILDNALKLVEKHNTEKKVQVSNWKEEVSKKFDFVINMWKDPSNDMDGLHTLATLKDDILEIVAARKPEVSNTDEERPGNASDFINRAIGMLKEQHKDEWLTAGYNGIVALLGYAKDKINRMELQLREAKQEIDQKVKKVSELLTENQRLRNLLAEAEQHPNGFHYNAENSPTKKLAELNKNKGDKNV